MDTKSKKVPSGKKVLLFSGGMDSLMMARVLKPDILLYINCGCEYQKAERKVLNQVALTAYSRAKLIIKTYPLVEYERDDFILPARNSFFCTVASQYGEHIILGAMSGDRSNDKDEEFVKLQSKLLNYMYADQHWCDKHTFNIDIPYKQTTKSQLMKQYLKEKGQIGLLFLSVSCYAPNDIWDKKQQKYIAQPCGQCKPCVRKWIALVNNHIEIPEGYFLNNPYETSWLLDVVDKAKKHEYRGKDEDEELLYALSTVNSSKPKRKKITRRRRKVLRK